MINGGISEVVKTVVRMLVSGDYDGLEKLTRAKRLTANEIAEAVKDYGANLVMPPLSAFETLDIIEVENVRPRTWSVRMDLWADGQGPSDLSLELVLKQTSREGYDIEIENIHVL